MNNLKTFEDFDWKFGLGKKETDLTILLSKIINEYGQNSKKNGKIVSREFGGYVDEQYSPIFYRYNMMNGDVLDVSNQGHIDINGKSIKKQYPHGALSKIQNKNIEKIYLFLKNEYEGNNEPY